MQFRVPEKAKKAARLLIENGSREKEVHEEWGRFWKRGGVLIEGWQKNEKE